MPPENPILPTSPIHSAASKRRSKSALWLLVVLALIAPSSAFAVAADELFADGNRLFRDDLYWAALLRYQQASDSGMNSALLHYNTGVAHYRAGQHIRARESLIKASRSYNLQALSHYNLGLNAMALDNNDEALDWFHKARNQDRNRQVRSLAGKAIKQIELGEAEDSVAQMIAEAELKEKEATNLRLRVRVGGGFDSNVFRSPSEPYIDQSDPNNPLITPIVQSGFYVPVSLAVKYSINSFEHESFFGAYRYGGRFYTDEALSNGNENFHELRFGSEYKRKEGTRTRRMYSAFAIAKHDEVYYDRDTGGARIVNDVDIEDRFNYLRYGPEVTFRQSHERLAIGATAVAQLWDYEDTQAVPQYDHEYFLLGANVQYRFTRTSLIRVTADAYKRHFGERPSFELDGSQPLGNTPVKYDYLELGITARQRITRSMWFSLDYLRTDREDRHVGYNNYVRNSYGGEFHWRIGNRFDFEAAGAFQVYDYENAFAFQNPAAGRKTLERIFGSVLFTFDMTPQFTLVTEYRYYDSQSNDTRIAYNRSRISVSVLWERK
jgi:tetratricopeptide (TPR) repeat protein